MGYFKNIYSCSGFGERGQLLPKRSSAALSKFCYFLCLISKTNIQEYKVFLPKSERGKRSITSWILIGSNRRMTTKNKLPLWSLSLSPGLNPISLHFILNLAMKRSLFVTGQDCHQEEKFLLKIRNSGNLVFNEYPVLNSLGFFMKRKTL